MRKLYFDLETCGLHGIAVLIQWSFDDGPTILHEVWKETVEDTLALIESFFQPDVCMIGFNCVFDLFHLNKLYNCLRLLKDKKSFPEPDDVVDVEMRARDGVCLKPYHILDLFLVAKKGPYQSLMERGDICIRRVPNTISHDLARELDKRVPLNWIYFARRAERFGTQWQVKESRDYETKEPLVGFDDVVLEFSPSSALKALAVDALKIPDSEILHFSDVEVDKTYRPIEFGFAPFAKATNEYGTWPDVLHHHVDHWRHNKNARIYAAKDVEYLKRLEEYFGYPSPDSDDDILTGLVAAVRWKGFAVDIAKLKALKQKTEAMLRVAPRAPRRVKEWLSEVMDETEKSILHGTDKNTLEAISKWTVLRKDYVCDKPEFHGIDNLGASCTEHGAPVDEHRAAVRAKLVLQARGAQKEIELYDKLIIAGRFHPSFKVIGALSGRMAGADDLNAQGIKRVNYVREAFPLKFEGEYLTGGDGKSFEPVIAAAEYGDEKLTADLKTGKKIHGLFGMFLFPEMSYDEILATEHTTDDRYTKSKSGFLALVYAGDEGTLNRKQGIPLEIGKNAIEEFLKAYPKIQIARQKVFMAFCPATQPIAFGPVIWNTPADYVETMFGFRRYYTLENTICKALYDLAKDPPIEWRSIKGKVQRRDRLQTNSGAAQSALYGAMFGLQSSNMRSASNHKIQGSGAQITKKVQTKIWELQPCGIFEWVVRLFQVHDEVQAVTGFEEIQDKVKAKMLEAVEFFKSRVPLLAFSWKKNMNNWSEK